MLCHHGLFWEFLPRAIGPAMKQRLKLLFDKDISVAGYHLPLDAHPEVGNNALICTALGLERAEPFGEYKGHTIGFVGRSEDGIPSPSCASAARPPSSRTRSCGTAGRRWCTAWAIISGGAPGDFGAAIAHGLDAFITGETAEHVMADARENGVHFIAGGHYATERFGIRRLGELVAERFGVEHRFVEIPNPI